MSPRCLLVPCLLLLSAAPAPQDAVDGLGVVPGQSFVLQLSAYDDLRSSVDFEAASYGTSVDGAQLDLSRAELAFGQFEQGMISYGFRDKEQARIVDVGDFRVPAKRLVRDVAPRPPMSVLHSLTLDNRQVTYRAPVDKRLNLREASAVTSILPDSEMRHIQPRLGHVYLLRYRGVSEVGDAWGRVVAFQVTEMIPNQSITIRGRMLPGSP
jgi:hypothetical protein